MKISLGFLFLCALLSWESVLALRKDYKLNMRPNRQTRDPIEEDEGEIPPPEPTSTATNSKKPRLVITSLWGATPPPPKDMLKSSFDLRKPPKIKRPKDPQEISEEEEPKTIPIRPVVLIRQVGMPMRMIVPAENGRPQKIQEVDRPVVIYSRSMVPVPKSGGNLDKFRLHVIRNRRYPKGPVVFFRRYVS